MTLIRVKQLRNEDFNNKLKSIKVCIENCIVNWVLVDIDTFSIAKYI